MQITTELTPHYRGLFEVFHTKSGEQYARLQTVNKYNQPFAHHWFKFDFDTGSYQSFDFEGFPVVEKQELQKQLEEKYQEMDRPMKEYIQALYEGCCDE